MTFSKHVYRTIDQDGNPILYNSVTRVILPVSSDESTLRANLFLEGQERESLLQVLGNKEGSENAQLGIVPSWACNLRCTHCFVADRLEQKQERELDAARVVAFAERWVRERSIKHLSVVFSGGENLLVVEKCLEVLDRLDRAGIKYATSFVTNLSLDLNDQHIDFIRRVDSVGVSLDGVEELHNAQRIPNGKAFNTFEKTLNNLKRLICLGLLPKIAVQACFSDSVCTRENIEGFLRLAFRLGFKKEQIRTGAACPTKAHPELTASFLDEIQNLSFRPIRCCKYRYNNFHTDWTGGVFSDFYSHHQIGTLDDSIDFLEEQKVGLTRAMAVLNDEKCQVCPVVAFCWGGCSKLEPIGKNFSEFCGQKTLIDFVNKNTDRVINWRK